MVEIIDIEEESSAAIPVSVGIVDNELIRFALRHLIVNLQDVQSKYRYEVTCENDYGDELMELFKKGDLPDILILDVSKPASFITDVMKFLKDYFPHVKILATSNSSSYDEVDRVLKDGAKGFLTKGESINYLIDALNTVCDNKLYLSETLSKEMLSAQYGFQASDNPESLNKREIEFLKYVCTEMTYKEIAEKMKLSARTVDGYRDSMFIKLGVKTRVGLVIYAIKNGITQIDDISRGIDCKQSSKQESDIVVYGRKGAGKSAFISFYQAKAPDTGKTPNKDFQHMKEGYDKKEDKWISSKEAMQILRTTSHTTLQRLREEKKIRFSQPENSLILYDLNSLMEYIETYPKDVQGKKNNEK